MPAFQNIVITDGQATPVSHTYAPANEEPKGVFNHVEANTTSALGSNVLRLSLVTPSPAKGAGQASSADRVYRAKLSLALPVLEVTSAATGTGIQPAPTIAYVLRANVELILPERSSKANRTDLRALVRSALGHAQWISAVDDLQSIF